MRLLRQRRRTAAEAEHRHLPCLRDQFRRLLQLSRIDLPLRLLQRASRLPEHGVPERHAAVAVRGLGLGGEIERADDEALRQLQLEIAHALAADGAAEPCHRRLADPGTLSQRRIGSIDRIFDVVEHDIGDAALGRPQLRIAVLHLRDDIGKAPDMVVPVAVFVRNSQCLAVSFGHSPVLPSPLLDPSSSRLSARWP